MCSVELAVISQMEILMATTVNCTGTAVNQIATMIVMDQPTTMTPADGNMATILAADNIATMPMVDQTATGAVNQAVTTMMN